jgi:hypothetical protein
VYYRRLCYEEWKKENKETPDDKFEVHWNSLSRYMKGVSDIILLTSSYLTLRYLDQKFSKRAKELVRHDYYRPITAVFDIALPQESTSRQGMST